MNHPIIKQIFLLQFGSGLYTILFRHSYDARAIITGICIEPPLNPLLSLCTVHGEPFTIQGEGWGEV